MTQHLSAITLLVHDYDEGIAFYVDKLGFDLLEDTVLSDTKRWVRVVPKGAETVLLLAKADGPDQVEDYARRKGMEVRVAERWLGPILNYDPGELEVA